MDELLRRLQKTQIEILDVIDGICRQNHLRYSLYAGTLLGAVRHQGFIPWDDDLDICMPREDYDRFIAIWEHCTHEGFVLQNKDNTPYFSQSFTKIRKDKTTFLQESDLECGYHTGIFVDIFPVDRMPRGFIKKPLFIWNCLKYQLFTREFIPSNSSLPIKLVSAFLLKITPEKRRIGFRHNLEMKFRQLDADLSLPVVFVEVAKNLREEYPIDTLENYVELQFGEKCYMCFENWADTLQIKYGDYMQLPPEEERVWKHHPLLIDFEHNYDELKDR